MEVESSSLGVLPGFRFHPTDEELVGYYLTRKVSSSQEIDVEVITDVDLYRIEPWDLQERCRYGNDEDQTEWYFFSHKDKKYPTGTRTNRATNAGFWKATGRDKAVVSKNRIIGMRKTLVFYEGRAPNGRKSNWIIHEYRLHTTDHGSFQEEGWVVCKAFRKPSPEQRRPLYDWQVQLPNFYQEATTDKGLYDSGGQFVDWNAFDNLFASSHILNGISSTSNPTTEYNTENMQQATQSTTFND